MKVINIKKCIYEFIYLLVFIFSENKNAIMLSNYPNKEEISEFITKCTSSAEENLLVNLFDWKSDSHWISENSKGVVRIKNYNYMT